MYVAPNFSTKAWWNGTVSFIPVEFLNAVVLQFSLPYVLPVLNKVIINIIIIIIIINYNYY